MLTLKFSKINFDQFTRNVNKL